MKATIEITKLPPPPPDVVTLSMSLAEAESLYDVANLSGLIGREVYKHYNGKAAVSGTLSSIRSSLARAGISDTIDRYGRTGS